MWTGAPGATRMARTREPLAFGVEVVPEATYDVFVRFGDDPDGSILYAGVVQVD